MLIKFWIFWFSSFIVSECSFCTLYEIATELEIDLICSEQGQQARHFPWFKNDDASLLKNIVCVERARYINKKFLEEYKNIDTPKRVLNYLSKVKGSTDLEVAQEIMRQMLVNDYVDVFVKK